MDMPRTLATIALAVAAAAASSPGAHAQAAACSRILATGSPEYAPVGYLVDGELRGVGAALAEAIATGLGVPIELVPSETWEGALDAARNGTVDLIFGVYDTEERRGWLTFVEPPFLMDRVVPMVAAGQAFPFAGQDDLVGRRGVSNAGESWGAAFDAFIAERLTVDYVVGTEAVFETLLGGGADYAIVGLYSAESLARRLGVRDRVELLHPPLSQEGLRLAFSSASPCASLAEAFGTAVAAAVASGAVDRLAVEANTELEARVPAP